MHRKYIAPLVVVLLLIGALFFSARGRVTTRFIELATSEALSQTPKQKKGGERRMVDMVADDSYLIDYGDSTVFILVGNFAAHHNGAVILADSAVRYSNQSFECFGNVLINQNTTYVYGDKAEYSHATNTATIFSELIKVVDGDAVMYTYNCRFDTSAEVGEFYGGCYVEKGESLMESERGYYNTQTHDLIAVDRVEMRDDKYQMKGDSVIFNTETEDAQYFHNTNIWNDKEEYLFANRGSYTKADDLHYLTRDAYILSPEREIWSDSIEYYRTSGHIIGRSNIQIDDTTQKIIGFADYGEWWDDPGNALFTRRPSMINYDPQQPDSLFLSADTLWMYTISAYVPEEEAIDAENTEGAESAPQGTDDAQDAAKESADADMPDKGDVSAATKEQEAEVVPSDVESVTAEDAKRSPERSMADGTTNAAGVEKPMPERVEDEALSDQAAADASADVTSDNDGDIEHDGSAEPHNDTEVVADAAVDVAEHVVAESDTTMLSQADTTKLTEKQLRYRAKLEKRRQRDTLRAEKLRLRDSVNAIKRAEKDSIRYIKDSLLDIKLDSIIAKRKARNARLADEEAARMERIKQKAEERRRRKIDKAKARALKRGKVYTGEDYTLDTLASDSLSVDMPAVDSLASARDTMQIDSLAADSLAADSLAAVEKRIPEDSVYKMIKAYRNVKMYRSDSQMVCDSLLILNTDSVIRLYIDPVMWNQQNQITSDSMAIYTAQQRITRVHFMGDPIMGSEIDTMYYNQVKGKDMKAYFENGSVYRNDVDGNAQTIYYMQEEENTTDVTGLMYIESAGISFYFFNGEIDKIAYKQNPEYVLYPMEMIPETQELRLPDFEWYYDRRPQRDSVVQRDIRTSRRESSSVQKKPRFPITERIDYDRRRLVENGEWEDRVDELSPEIIEWRNSRMSYQNRE